MWEAIGKYVGGKVLTAILVVGVAGAGIWFWRHPDDLALIWRVVKYALAWIGFVLVLPWALFFVPPWVLSKESNAAGAIMLVGYLAMDVTVAVLLAGGAGHSFLTWVVLLLGFLAAGVYNYLVCDYLATRAEDSM